jgi:hypothetical protein
MNMPGFNAEASLYKSNGRYQAEAFKQANEGVYPARIACDTCSDVYDDCLDGCGNTPRCRTSCRRVLDNCLNNCIVSCRYFHGTWYCD